MIQNSTDFFKGIPVISNVLTAMGLLNETIDDKTSYEYDEYIEDKLFALSMPMPISSSNNLKNLGCDDLLSKDTAFYYKDNHFYLTIIYSVF